MKTFHDFYNNEVKLSFEDHPFEKEPKHVWVICRCDNQWLLTDHKDRGLEFPGGKVEDGETAEQAAIREVKEETGGIVNTLTYVGQYYVTGKGGNIAKNIYFALVDEVIKQPSYFETKGPVLLSKLPNQMDTNSKFSFMMKDAVLPTSLKQIKVLDEFD
ncbi:RNA deprotection pyrophosphohydrolase [Aquibacillus rhizosphaerae]|uniref:Nucleoside triphosphatase YtkD n=1 Tax=Aquibacillus rhizosphaerae TaxID=3051431 RepID=A0ABT7L9N7_9BACI|nr:nucleoside triphosphatase YtkD [Aquibacillus sp. LR5S19]MDL4842568.1 nucleoside triphosphatase YtkD [Aquibacillus sp. LR5S19]